MTLKHPGNVSYELAHDKIYIKTFVITRFRLACAEPPNTSVVLVYPLLNNLEAAEGTCRIRCALTHIFM